ncbi:MAG: exosortase/archaeosortase family protein [Verrucomicrobia bacterium]|nr:exosortase/archaeosortase family protein [Verrucomicrobiota bacterium]
MSDSASTTGRNAFDVFRAEFPSTWRGIPDKPLFFGLLAAWLALFHFLGNSTFGYVASPSLLEWTYTLYTRPDSEDSHGLLIPFVVLALLWWKRADLAAVPKKPWPAGLALLAGALGLHLVGFLIQQPKVSVVAMLAGIYVLIAVVWGWRLAWAMAFPFGLMVFCVPIGDLADPITIPLRKVSTDISVFVCKHLLGIPVIQVGIQIIDPKGGYHYEVAAACSGIRSLVTLFALTTIYGFISFRTPWKRALMVFIAAPLALIGNVIRLVGIVVAAEAFGQKAGEVVHDWFGFLTFALALAVMIALGNWLRDPEPPPAAAPVAPQPDPA